MHPSSAISSELTTSGLRAPQPSPIRITRPNSDDENDDDDDVRLTHSHSRATSGEADHADSDPNPDPAVTGTGRAPAPAPAPAPSSAQPKADNDSVPAAAGAGAGTPNVPFSISLTLRNTGSVARDHLASERTFLAYVRTSLSFASAGVGASHPLPTYPTSISERKKNSFIALVQLFRVSVNASNSSNASHDQLVVSSYARPLGATVVGFGMAVLVMGESPSVFFFALRLHPFRSPHAHVHIHILTIRRGVWSIGPGTYRYFLIQRALPQGFFPAARLSVFLQAVSLATLVGIVFGILVAVR